MKINNRIKFSKLRDPINDALDAAIMGSIPYHEPKTFFYQGRDGKRPLLDYTEDLFPQDSSQINQTRKKQEHITVDLQDNKPPVFLACRECKQVVAKGKRVTTCLKTEESGTRQTLWLMNEEHTYKKLKVCGAEVSERMNDREASNNR